MSLNGLSEGFNAFRKRGYKKALDKATKGAWKGQNYKLEVCTDGTYKIHPGKHTQMNTGSIVLTLPRLNDTEWSEDPKLRQYDVVLSELADEFKSELEEYELTENEVE